jgi:hypothetical protein
MVRGVRGTKRNCIKSNASCCAWLRARLHDEPLPETSPVGQVLREHGYFLPLPGAQS